MYLILLLYQHIVYNLEQFIGEEIFMSEYANPDILVSTEWVAEHLNDANVRIIESNEDELLYPSGHIPGAVEVDWTSDLNHQVVRDYIGQDGFSALASRIGITPETTVVFYGDKRSINFSYIIINNRYYNFSQSVNNAILVSFSNNGQTFDKRCCLIINKWNNRLLIFINKPRFIV